MCLEQYLVYKKYALMFVLDIQGDQDQETLLWVQNLLSYFRTGQYSGDHCDLSLKYNRFNLGKNPKPTGNEGSII